MPHAEDFSSESALPENPLPPCPATPNCARETRLYPEAPDLLFARVQRAVEALRPAEAYLRSGDRRLNTVFRVFFFKDDVALAVTPHAGGSALHVRSASRVGRSDLGVNARRVRRLFRELDEASQGRSALRP